MRVDSKSATAVRSPCADYHQRPDEHTMIPVPHHPAPPPYSFSGDGGAEDEFPRRDERFPQWSNQETRDFIEIRAQCELSFASAQRIDNLWETIADRMRGKGYRRTADQCKCKWANLVARYKEEEACDVENAEPCPFYNELHAFFMMRNNMMKQPQASGVVKGRKRLKTVPDNVPQEEFPEEQEDEEEETIAVPKRKDGKERRKRKGEKDDNLEPSVRKSGSVLKGVEDMLRKFMAQQETIDMQWRELMEKKAEEREAFEQEWRQKLETLERERLTMEQAWREREEQRMLREERRAEKRDALLSTLLNKLINDQSP